LLRWIAAKRSAKVVEPQLADNPLASRVARRSSSLGRRSCRKNSKTLPANWLVPLRGDVDGGAELRPSRLKSSTSDLHLLNEVDPDVVDLLALLRSRIRSPSTSSEFDTARAPLIDWFDTLRLVVRSSWSSLSSAAPESARPAGRSFGR
jgi:hypothetical protein